jgi:hypothetical protein
VNYHNSSYQKEKDNMPYELFTGQETPWSLRDVRIFGSPTYVLQKELQNGTSNNKWKLWVWRGIYIGNSTFHSSAIPLIHNPITTHISPQFHVLFDEHFTTVTNTLVKDTDTYLEKLFHTSAWWLYKDPYSDHPHTFDGFWDHTKDGI